MANVVVDPELTAADRDVARNRVAAVRVTRDRGQVLVEEGRELTAADLEMLRQAELDTTRVDPRRVAAAVIIALLAGAASGAYLYVARPAALIGVRRLSLFALLLLLPALALKFTLPLLLPDVERHFLAYAIPIAAAPMAAAVLLDLGVAILLTLVLAVVAAFVSISLPFADAAASGQLETARVWLAVSSGSLAGVFVAARALHVNRYLVAGLATGGAVIASLVAFWLLDADRQIADLAWIVAGGVVSGLASALIGVGFFLLLSRPFGIITRVELMELAQFGHPLLRRLQDEAPGTFQHSVLVSNMAERAADRIGADPLLVRVGAYYHDVGKLTAPEFFIENQSAEEDPHGTLDPLQSTRLIQQHVAAGVELARRERLPAAVSQFIPQHHGTRRVQFFYRRAAAEDPSIDPELFRYPGPRPQSREAAIIMLADSSEAAVRASGDRTVGRISTIVNEIVRERIEEDQFAECDISLRDLRIVTDSFVQTLNAVYHPSRPLSRAHRARAGGAQRRRGAREPLARWRRTGSDTDRGVADRTPATRSAGRTLSYAGAMRAAIVVFPGTWSDGDCVFALEGLGVEARRVWHREADLGDADLVVLPGGFSYGDYLRCGAIARFSPVMQAVRAHADAGGLVIGICNGFQILCEAGMLPGVLMRNASLQFRCEPTHLVAAEHRSPFTAGIEPGRVLQVPISHGEGNYFADPATLEAIEAEQRVAFRYCTAGGAVTAEANPNGSVANIAGVLNERRNVLGMMPHPERASAALLGGEDGNAIWGSALASLRAGAPTA